MSHLSRGFQEQQAAFGSADKQTPTACFVNQVIKVFRRLETEQRKLKSVLAISRLRMADTNIAACLGQYGNNFVDETNRFGGNRLRIICADGAS